MSTGARAAAATGIALVLASVPRVLDADPGGCYPNQTCDPGLWCEPTSQRCVTDLPAGSENGPCGPGGECDAGLTCDGELAICLATADVLHSGDEEALASLGASPDDALLAITSADGRGRARLLTAAVVLAAGTGDARGTTETGVGVESCCLTGVALVVAPAIGIQLSRRIWAGLGARLGFPIGANFDDHPGMSLAIVGRVGAATGARGGGVRGGLHAGYGVLRGTLPLEGEELPDGRQLVDTLAQGPLLLGASVGGGLVLGPATLVVELTATAGIATGDQHDDRPINSGVTVDLGVGIELGL